MRIVQGDVKKEGEKSSLECDNLFLMQHIILEPNLKGCDGCHLENFPLQAAVQLNIIIRLQ